MKIVIVSGCQSELSTIQTLIETIPADIEVIWAKPGDIDAVSVAEAFNIPVTYDLSKVLNIEQLDLIIDLSGSREIGDMVRKYKPQNATVVDHAAASLLCHLLESENRKTYDLVDELTKQHWALYEIGITLSSAKDLSDVYEEIMRQATKLTNTPMGSLAVYDKESGEMYFTASTGFRGEIAIQESWKLRTGGLTSYILNQKDPVAISNIDDYPDFNNPQLIREGIKSLIACPLILDNNVIGIIYVDDFRVRDFTERDISILSLLSTYAVIAIEKAKLLEETKKLAITDDLTKLYNLRYLTQKLAKELSRAKRYKEPLSFIILDIDHFKRYNDTYGHTKGNELLIELASLMRIESRDSDVVARYGGEEFTIICPKTDKENAYKHAERLRRKVEEYDFPFSNKQSRNRITISIGIASYPEDASDPQELIDKADSALYLSKRDGRNRVSAHQ